MGFCKDFCVGILSILLVFLAINNDLVGGSSWNSVLKMPTDKNEDNVDAETGTRWAVLLAGSSGYWNYRHQSDVCHAYQVLRKGGLKEENIVIFMYDDIANNEENPRPGTIINHPDGQDIYAGVPKDYTGSNVTVDNFLAVLLGDKSAVKGGSGKVVDSGPNDHVFVFYSDHGGPGVLGMPTPPYLFADDLISVLKKKHAAGSYKEMVLYIEACESGSIFEGMLPDNLNIYATTASNAVENSWGTYCPGMAPPPPPGYDTCLGDLYSVSWMEDSEIEDLKKETLAQQYNLVKFRTSNRNTYKTGSHVMQYGDIKMSRGELYRYIGFDKNASNIIRSFDNALPFFNKESMAINQRDADVLFMWQKYKKSREDTQERLDAQKKLFDFISHRMHIDKSIELVGNLLFGSERGRSILKHARSPGLPLVDDWDCLKQMVRSFETHCGSLSQYGMKHMRAIANICNNGVRVDAMAKASAEACYRFPSSSWSSLHKGFSA